MDGYVEEIILLTIFVFDCVCMLMQGKYDSSAGKPYITKRKCLRSRRRDMNSKSLSTIAACPV